MIHVKCETDCTSQQMMVINVITHILIKVWLSLLFFYMHWHNLSSYTHCCLIISILAFSFIVGVLIILLEWSPHYLCWCVFVIKILSLTVMQSATWCAHHICHCSISTSLWWYHCPFVVVMLLYFFSHCITFMIFAIFIVAVDILWTLSILLSWRCHWICHILSSSYLLLSSLSLSSWCHPLINVGMSLSLPLLLSSCHYICHCNLVIKIIM